MFPFFSFKKRSPKTAQPLSSDVLKNEDANSIERIAKEKESLKKDFEKQNEVLDAEMVAIQRSTKTTIPQLSRLHNDLRMKYKWYYTWHTYRGNSLVHDLVLIIYIMGLASYVAFGGSHPSVRAATTSCTWNNGGGTNIWNSSANWSCGNVPDNTNDVIFDGAVSTANITIDVAANVGSITIYGTESGHTAYTGTITANDNLTTDTANGGTGDYFQGAGTYIANATVLTIAGNWDSSAGTYTYGTSTVTFTGTGKTVKTPGSILTTYFYNVNINGTITTASHIGSSNNFSISGTLTVDTSYYWVINNEAAGTVTINGGGILTGPGLFVLKRGAASPAMVNSGTISVAQFFYWPKNGDSGVPVTATTYGAKLSLIGQGNGTYNTVLTAGTLSATTIEIFGASNGGSFTLDNTTYNASITATTFNVGQTAQTARYGLLKPGTGTMTIGTLNVYASDGSGDNKIDSTGVNTPWTISGNATNNDKWIAGSSYITVGGSWTVTNNGGFTYGTSTVDLTGTGNVTTFGNLNDFYNLKCAYNTKTTTFQTNIGVMNLLYTYSGGTLTHGSAYLALFKSDGDPMANDDANDATLDMSVDYRPTADISIGGHTFAHNMSVKTTTNNVKVTLTSNVSCGYFAVYSLTVGKKATVDTGSANVTTSADVSIGWDTGRDGGIDFGSGTHSINGQIAVGSTGSVNTIDFDASNVTVGTNLNLTGITVTPGSSTITMTVVSGTRSITSAGNTLNNVILNTASTAFSIADDLTLNGNLTVTKGTFNANGKNVTCVDMTASGSETRALTLGAGTWTVSGNWDSSGTNLTLTYTGNTLILTGASKTLKTTGSGTNFNHLTINGTISLLAGVAINGDLTVSGTLTLGGATAITVSNTAANMTVNPGGVITGPNFVILYRIDGSPAMVNNGTLSVQTFAYRTFDGNVAVPVTSTAYNTVSLNVISGTGLATYVPTAGTLSATSSIHIYGGGGGKDTILDNTVNNANISATTINVGWSGVLNSANIFKPGTGTISATTVNVYATDGTHENKIDMTAKATPWTVAGAWTNSDVVVPGNSTVNFTATSSKNITSGTGGFNNVSFTGVAGTWVAQDALTATGNFTVSAGTFNTNGQDITVGGNVDLTGGSFTQGTGRINLNGSGAQSFTAGGTGAGHTPYNLVVTNASASGVTFTDDLTLATGGTFTDTTANSRLIFTDNKTYSFPLININGSGAGNVTMTWNSGSHGHWHFIVPGTPTVTYVTVDHSDATGSGAQINAVSNVTDGTGNIYWDFGIPNPPTIGTPSSPSSTSIRWVFSDNASGEEGFRVYDGGNNIVATCATPNLTYCDETGLNPNVQYSGRTVTAYKGALESSHSAAATAIYTLANTPGLSQVSQIYGQPTQLQIIININSNPAGTQFAIQETQQSEPDLYVQANGTLNEAPVWQTYAQWGSGVGVTVAGLTAATQYTFQVKAQNGDNISTELGPASQQITAGTGSTVAGVLYKDTGSTRWDSAKNIKVTVNGLLPASGTSSAVDGSFSLTANEPIDSNDVIIIYISGTSEKGSTVTKVSAGGNLTGIDIYQNYTILRHEGAIEAMTNTILAAADGYYSLDSDSLFSVDGSNNVTFDQGVYIAGGKTYTPGGNVNVAGSWNSAGNFTHANTTVKFNGTSTGKTITSAGQSFQNLTFDGAGGEWTNQDGMIVSGNFLLTTGSVNYGTTKLTLNGSGGQSITSGGATFHDLDLLNSSGSGISFLDPLTVGGTLKNHTATASIKLKSGVTHSVHTLDLLGADGEANSVKLRSTDSGTQFGLTYTDITTADYLDIQDANNVGSIIPVPHAKDSGNNTNWHLADSYVITSHTPQVAGSGWSETLYARDYYGNVTDSDSVTALTLTADSPTVRFYTSGSYVSETTSYTLQDSALTIYLKDNAPNNEIFTFTASDIYATSIQSTDISVANDPPVSTMTSPADGALFGAGIAQFRGTALDPLGGVVAKVEVQINNGDWQISTNTGTNYSTWIYDYPFSLSGVYTLKARATDSMGRVETLGEGISVSVDADIPSATITTPIQNEWISASTFEIVGTATDVGLTPVNKVQISTDGSTWLDTTSTSTNFATWSFAWAGYPDQKDLTIYAKAIDTNNNVSQSYSVKVGIDTTAPTKPTNLKTFDVSDRLSGKYQALFIWQPPNDATSGLKEYQVFRGAEKIATVSDAWYLDRDVSSSKYDYHLVVFDNAGNSVISDAVSAELTANSNYQASISNIQANPSKLVSIKGKTTTMITWATDKPATSGVNYGLGEAKAFSADGTNKLNMGHNIILTDLEPNTLYHYQVMSKDMYGHEISSGDLTFTTSPESARESVVDTIWKTLQKSFQWFTKALAASGERIGIKSPSQVSPDMLVFDVSDPAAKTYAAMIVTSQVGGMTVERSVANGDFTSLATTGESYYLDQNLDMGKKYSYRIKGLEGAVSIAPATEDNSAPLITDIKATEIGFNKDSAEVLITWQTDKLTSSSLNINGKELSDEKLNQSHAMIVSGLKLSSTHHYTLTATSEQGASTTSFDQTTTTSAAPVDDSAWTVIIKTLQNVFGRFSQWMRE